MSSIAPTIIVGGGIGGLATALSLASHGRQVHVLERAPEFGELGAGIQLAPNALHVLKALGVLDSILAEAVRPVRAMMMDARTGDLLAEMDFGAHFQETFGAPYIVTHRSDLLNSLVKACRASDLVTLENSRQVIRLEQRGENVLLTCDDGARYSAELVIGADGLRSVCREYVLGDGPPVCSGDVAYRGAIPIARARNVSGEPTIKWWIGPNVHLIQYPVRGGHLFNQVGVFTSDAYRDGVDPGSTDWGTPEELDERFSDLDERVRSSAALLNRDRRWALFDRRPAPTWTKGRVSLIGDAAHPMLQYLAQGGCQALEDAFTLGACFADSSVEVAVALSRYESIRRPRAGLAQTWARRVGDIVHGDGLVAILRDGLLRRLDAKDFRYVDWLYRAGKAPR
ncbi:FAD-dependent monooxygenase [Amycolatopsis pithecellobii]|uniref:FAD-dependent oxidoreductase n=1 Tax=Amycolatopsis pithecellobii TaxID=664692 RepID=A0A6N7YKY0_9PSEU|nr:FAD-dependent monooxygenase [Amycolatopsis pithecellobii]MTD52548.1 FAD-dependent oxidoreductase [Amycolatopsis pithecellobii]